MSNLIKTDAYITLDEAKVVNNLELLLKRNRVQTQPSPQPGGKTPEELETEREQAQEIERIRELKEGILRDAEEFAENRIHEAQQEAAALRVQAEEEIAAWWNKQRQADEEETTRASELGYQNGYREGIIKADEDVRSEYAAMTAEASTVLENAHRVKEEIIREAEPFLIELSTGIAEKILVRELTMHPEQVMELTKAVLMRKREKGLVTLCVAPRHFAYFHDARHELQLVIDSQAELQILPDASVPDYGCVMRTEFGSVDARIDTQLKEIKQALLSLLLSGEPHEATDEP